jgi:hypothetical protein
VRDDIAPAVVAAVGAAREASAPVYAEAATRATDAVKALRGSDAAQSVRASAPAKAVEKAAAKALKRKTRSDNRAKRLKIGALIGAGVAAIAVLKRRNKATATAYPVPTDVTTSTAQSNGAPSNDSTTSLDSPTSGT